MSEYFCAFEFDLPGALLAQLTKQFDVLSPAILDAAHVKKVPDAQGVYQIAYKGVLVYIGKTDSKAGLRQRLGRHAEKIRHRLKLDPREVTFKAIQILVFTAVDLEQDLIAHYKGAKPAEWNNSGFGSNDPGRERDTSKIKPDHFDAKFPIDIDARFDPLILKPGSSAADLFELLKAAVPYVVRVERSGALGKAPHADFLSSKLGKQVAPQTTRDAVALLMETLPPGWQGTVLPGYIIIYKERKSYVSARVTFESSTHD